MSLPRQDIYVPRYWAHHPELKDGEIWVTNSSPSEVHEFSWSTKRVGKIAYNRHGHVAGGLVPVFVTVEEYIGNRYEYNIEDIIDHIMHRYSHTPIPRMMMLEIE